MITELTTKIKDMNLEQRRNILSALRNQLVLVLEQEQQAWEEVNRIRDQRLEIERGVEFLRREIKEEEMANDQDALIERIFGK